MCVDTEECQHTNQNILIFRPIHKDIICTDDINSFDLEIKLEKKVFYYFNNVSFLLKGTSRSKKGLYSNVRHIICSDL